MQVTIPQATPTPATFARASTATYINEDGVLMYSAVDQPRYQDGLLLLEAAGSNLLEYSEDMRNTAEAGGSRPWTQFDDTGDAVAVLSVSTTKPDGATGSVSKLTANTTASVQRQTSQQISGLADNAVVTFSVCLKAGEVPRASLLIGTKSPAYPTALFDLTTGVVSSKSGGGGAPPVAGIVALAGGWYRCWVAVSVGAGASTPGVIVQLKNAAGGHYAGAVGDGLYLWGAQAEIGSIPTSYIPRTGTAAASRAADSYSGGYLVSTGGLSPYFPISELDEDNEETPEWGYGITYSAGDLVHRKQTHRVYKRVSYGVSTIQPEDDTTNWIDVRSTYYVAPFSPIENNQLLVAHNIYLSIPIGEDARRIYFSGIRAASVVVVLHKGTTTYLRKSFDQTSSGDWSFWVDASLITNHDVSSPFILSVSILAPESLLISGIGYIIIGKTHDIGGTLQGARLGITDYSRKETDDFGTTTFTRRGYAKRLTAETLIPLSDMSAVFGILADLRATPALWVASDSSQLAPLTVYGWCKDFGVSVSYARHSLVSVEIEGLI